MLIRALRILVFLLLAGARFAVGWALLLVLLAPRARRKEWFGQTLLWLLRRLGATFIKVGQIMSTRPDLFPPHVVRALEELQDHVGPFAWREVEATLAAELGRPVTQIFEEIDHEPIASASVAQVHRARLPGGRVVAVKVRRPDVERLCEFDLGVMRGFARLVALWPSFALLAPVESVDQFARGIRMQLDFTLEAAHNRRFRANFAGDPDVVFPALVDELCTARVLVMDFVRGHRLLPWVDGQSGGDPKRLAQVGFRLLLKMIFEDGFVHADLHPGNLLVTDDGKLAVLDLGLVGEMDAGARGGFARYFAAWVAGDGKTMAQLMAGMSPGRVRDYAGFEAAVIAFVQRYEGRRLREVEVSGVMFDMLNILRRYRVRANPTFTLVNIAIAVAEGVGKQLDPDVDLFHVAAPYFAAHGFGAAPAG